MFSLNVFKHLLNPTIHIFLHFLDLTCHGAKRNTVSEYDEIFLYELLMLPVFSKCLLKYLHLDTSALLLYISLSAAAMTQFSHKDHYNFI